MRKFLVAAATISTLFAFALPASAAQATTFTMNIHGAFPPFPTGKPCTQTPTNPIGDLGWLTSSGNGVFHVTVNSTGSWFTGTNEGTFLFQPISNAVALDANGNPIFDSNGNPVIIPSTPQFVPGAVTISGHFAVWFGDENNQSNEVNHFVNNIMGTDSTGQPFSAHIVGHMGTSASTPPNVNVFFKGSCS